MKLVNFESETEGGNFVCSFDFHLYVFFTDLHSPGPVRGFLRGDSSSGSCPCCYYLRFGTLRGFRRLRCRSGLCRDGLLLGERVFVAAVNEGLDQAVHLRHCLLVYELVIADLVFQDASLHEDSARFSIFFLFFHALRSRSRRRVLLLFVHLLILIATSVFRTSGLLDLLDFSKELVYLAFLNLAVLEEEVVDVESLGGLGWVLGLKTKRLRHN